MRHVRDEAATLAVDVGRAAAIELNARASSPNSSRDVAATRTAWSPRPWPWPPPPSRARRHLPRARTCTKSPIAVASHEQRPVDRTRAAEHEHRQATVETMSTPSFDLDRRQAVERPHRRPRLQRVADDLQRPHQAGRACAAARGRARRPCGGPSRRDSPTPRSAAVAREDEPGRPASREQVELGRREAASVRRRAGAGARVQGRGRPPTGRARGCRAALHAAQQRPHAATSSRSENGLVM